MSDETGNGVFVLHSVSGFYAEVHISVLSLKLAGMNLIRKAMQERVFFSGTCRT